MQHDFVDGSLGTPEAQAIVPAVREKIAEYAADAEARIVFTRDTHQSNYLETREGRFLPVEHCLEGTWGWQILEGLVPEDTVAVVNVINKPTFGYDGWRELLGEGEFSFELVGLCTDICVVSNALLLKALYPEADIAVAAACCAGVTPEKHVAALATMESCQIEIG